MQLSLSTGALYKRPWLEVLDLLAQTRCRNLELCLNQPFIGIAEEDIVEAVRARGFRVLSLHAPLSFFRPAGECDERDGIELSLSLAYRLGASVVVTHDVLRRNGDGAVSLDAEHRANLLACAGTNGVTLTTENMPPMPVESFLTQPEILLAFLRNNDCYLTLDTTHAAALGLDILAAYETFKPHIRNIHFSDYLNGSEHKFPGDGQLPLRELLAALRRDNYQGLLTLELDLDNPDRNRVSGDKEMVERLNEALAYCAS